MRVWESGVEVCRFFPLAGPLFFLPAFFDNVDCTYQRVWPSFLDRRTRLIVWTFCTISLASDASALTSEHRFISHPPLFGYSPPGCWPQWSFSPQASRRSPKLTSSSFVPRPSYLPKNIFTGLRMRNKDCFLSKRMLLFEKSWKIQEGGGRIPIFLNLCWTVNCAVQVHLLPQAIFTQASRLCLSQRHNVVPRVCKEGQDSSHTSHWEGTSFWAS